MHAPLGRGYGNVRPWWLSVRPAIRVVPLVVHRKLQIAMQGFQEPPAANFIPQIEGCQNNLK